MELASEIFPEVHLSDYDEVMLSDEERAVNDTPMKTPAGPPAVSPLSDNPDVQKIETNAVIVPTTNIAPVTSSVVPVAAAPNPVTVPIPPNPVTPLTSAKSRSSGPKQCRLCPKFHHLFRCIAFRKMPIEKRLRIVVANQYCFNCLRADHQAKSCPDHRRCHWCNELHHSLLHGRSRASGAKAPSTSAQTVTQPTASGLQPVLASSNPTTSSSPSAASGYIAHMSRLPIGRIISLAPTLIVRLRLTDSSIPVRALLDPCCRVSQICESLVEHLRWPVSVFNDFAYCDFVVTSSYDDSTAQYVTARVAKLTCGVTPQISLPPKIGESFRGLELADPTFYRSGAVAVVLGPEIYARIIESRVFTQPGLPTAQYTSFGWVVSGPVPL